MLVAESHRSRRFIGRLDKGEELCGAIRAFCQERDIRSGEVRASGLLSGVELVPYDREAKGYTAPKRIRAFFELLQLGGTIATRDGELVLSLHATLSRDNTDRGGGIDIVGGHLVAAEVLTCELVIDSFDDVVLVREFDPALGVYALKRGEPRPFTPDLGGVTTGAGGAAHAHTHVPAPAARPPAAAPPPQAARAPAPREPEVRQKRPMPPTSISPSLLIPEGGAPKPRGPAPFSFSSPGAQSSAAVANKPAPTPSEPPAQSAAAIASANQAGGGPSWADAVKLSSQLAEEPQRTLKPGDVLEHPKFGRCEVLRFDEDQDRVSVRIPAGRLVELGLEVLHLEHLRSEGSKQFYKVHAGRR